MDPQTDQVDIAMTEADPLPVLTISSKSSVMSAATPLSDASFNVASLSSTPPTSVSPDNISLASDHDVHTPKATAVLCHVVGESEPQLLLALCPNGATDKAPEQQPTMMESDSEGREPPAPLPGMIGLSPTKQADGPSEPPSEALSEAFSELDVQAQLERQLMREAELCADSDPASAAIASDTTAEQQNQHGVPVAAPESPAPTIDAPTPKRSTRARASLPSYNLSKLFGTDIHGRRASKGDDVKVKKRIRTLATNVPVADEATTSTTPTVDAPKESAPSEQTAHTPATDTPRVKRKYTKRVKPENKEVEQQQQQQPKPEIATRRTARLSGATVPSAVILPLPSLRKRGKKAAEEGLSRLKRELLRLQDTKEFAHVDDRPTITTVWSKGKFVDPRTLEEPAEGPRSSKRPKITPATVAEQDEATTAAEEEGDETAALEDVPEPKKRTAKIWLDKGLYAGQKAPEDPSACLTTQEKKKLAQVPELLKFSEKPNKTLPAPLFNGLRLLLNGRDFKLPYDICNPLPAGHPKPPTYRSLTKNRFVGEAALQWKKQKHMDDLPSKCVCKPEDGCEESCQNRIMLYECDDTNCNIGEEFCGNRPFATLTARTQGGGQYRVGVEVFKTEDRGFGVRANRCFRPHQIIMEYTGEIITEAECLNRMDTRYKNNECYYLMSFTSNIVIDATSGSIARFVNHSCSPNCRMIKWIVSGQPRMALFAGDRPIMTGEELTYDYNFAPYSKDPQKCLCGADNCRGVLGPKPRDVKVPRAVPPPKDEATKKLSLKATIKAGKRKLQELLGGEQDVYDDVEGASMKATKKRKVGEASGATSFSRSSLQVAKGAANALKRSVSSVSLSAKAALSSKHSVSSLRRTSTGGPTKGTIKRSPGRPKNTTTTTTAEGKVITSSKEAVAIALASLGIQPSNKAAKTVAKASGTRAVVAKASTKSLFTSNGNAKTMPKSDSKGKTTPTTKASGSATKRGRKPSGYIPPSSQSGSTKKAQAQALFSSSRKKTPSRKIIESTTAGTASVTKPKSTPQAKAKTKVVKKAEIAPKQRTIVSMLKAAGAQSDSEASPSGKTPPTKKARKSTGKTSAKKSPAAKATVRAVPASPVGANGRPSTPTGSSSMGAALGAPESALSSVRSTPELSPPPSNSKSKPKQASAPRAAAVTVMPQIRVIQRNLNVDDDSESS